MERRRACRASIADARMGESPSTGVWLMKLVEYTFDTTVEFSGDVREHAFVLRCVPRRGEGVTLLKSGLDIEPNVPHAMQFDSFGNELVSGFLREPHDHISYSSCGTARIELPPSTWNAYGAEADEAFAQDHPHPHLGETFHPLFKYPSPLAKPDEPLRAWALQEGFTAAEFSRSPQAALDAFERLGQAVHNLMAYEPGSTGVNTTAGEAFAARRGVCQDFAHIMAVVLREAGIPARYVSGLTVGEGATHAWVQAYVNGIWHGYDPTRDTRVDESYLPLAVGRDWSDCPIERGSFWGLVDQTQTVFMTMREIEA